MGNFVAKHRWVILAAGAAIQILTGIPAAWGVFQKPVGAEYGLSSQQCSLIFACTIAFFGIGCVPGGALQDRFGPKVAGLSGSALLAGGMFLSAWVPTGAGLLLIGSFSLLVGMGCAFLYPAVMSPAQKWYADRKGLATGVIGGAVGLSGSALTLLVRGLNAAVGIRGVFLVLGGLLAAVCGGASMLLCNPLRASPSGGNGPAGSYSPGELLRTRQYYLIFSAVALAAPCVLLFSPIILELGQQRGLTEQQSLAAIAIGSFGSAAGRLAAPALSDRLGRRRVDLVLFAALCALSVLFAFSGGWWVVAVYTALTFCYSGQAALLPALATDLFGWKNAGVNYGLLALGTSAGSLAFTFLAGGFSAVWPRHLTAALAAAGGFVALALLRPTPGGRL